MDQLVAFVSEKTGLSPEMSRQAAEAVLTFLKSRVPEPLAAQIDGFLAGDGKGDAGGFAKALGGIFGGK